MKMRKLVFIAFMLLVLGAGTAYSQEDIVAPENNAEAEAAYPEDENLVESTESTEPAFEDVLGMDMQNPEPSQTIVVTPEGGGEDGYSGGGEGYEE